MKPPTVPPPRAVVHWFRRDLRTHDNPSLNAALALCETASLPLIPLYVLSPAHARHPACGRVRAAFLLDSLSALRDTLFAQRGLRLRVATGDPADLVPRLAARWRAAAVFCEREYAPDARRRDAHIARTLSALRVDLRTHHGFLLYDPDALLAAAAGRPPRNMSAMLRLVARVGDPPAPVALRDARLPLDAHAQRDAAEDMFDPPTLAKLGFDELPQHTWESFRGGEHAAMARFDEFLSRDGGRVAAAFAKPDTSPAALSPRATTVLSPYLALGCLSSRLFHARLRELEARRKVAPIPQTRLWGQLMWREHFWLLAYATPNFHTMRGNPLCRQIDWRRGADADNALQAWESAKTGFPWIDALMTQLRVEGFVHHLGRHSLACFLTRGNLWVSWERGAKVFERLLIDFDYALNAANWMWLSCSAFFVMYYRVYSPVAFAKKWDKDGEFVRHYLPVLRKMPTRWVHEPWKAPIDVQRRAGCVVGVDYPKPIVDHAQVSKENIAAMKENYARGEFGVVDRDTADSGPESPDESRKDTQARTAPNENNNANRRQVTNGRSDSGSANRDDPATRNCKRRRR